MSNALELAKHYFDLSNTSNFIEIEKLFVENTTFCARSGEYFLGRDDIMVMQKAHHGCYQQLKWHVNALHELKPGIICFDFSFEGVKQNGEQTNMSGIEYLIIQNDKIRHIDVLNK